ncbi:phospholipid-transporting ATPase VD isoform X3 [Magallana gigas]|uniref:phospholipid-transporting ATPase VD isoform X3 n=1 Tax=Magallana gigas TaxID=29159 RepID=UPI0005C36F37|nr:probable phospholipid-transporting ATPase VD isoform X3 [Crassostrea gigas]|eukprot:XP_011442077.1 PREDICTED: probable phospholipid-transporting ATPase VD isoform X3 [Crassostrea gigas]
MGNIFNKSNKSGPRFRTVVPNHVVGPDIPVKNKNHPNCDYRSNRIKTTKYSALTFLPKNLFEQFHRFANLYFILVVALNWVPQVQAFGKEIAMIPVIFVLAVTAVKDAFEDFRRYKSDRKINHHTCRRYSSADGRYVKSEWMDVHAGDFVHLACDEIIPADILLLHSSDPLGICHLETSNLDGETNLKQRQIVHGLKYEGSKFAVSKFKYSVECELPNAEIYKFNGYIKLETGEKVSLNKDNLLLRGCTIKNTDFVEGIVLYAGHETKAMLNNRNPRYKRSKLERRINRDVIYCVILLLFLCLFCAIASGIWLSNFEDSTVVLFIPFESLEWYNPYFQAFVVFFTYIIIFQTVIPLPLYVSVEIVKLGQVYFINNDIELYYEPIDKRIECRALNITEDLGQIEYIFSDKTGTLTENQMEFKTCTIGGTDYPHTPEYDEDDFSDTGSRYSLANISRTSSIQAMDIHLEPGITNALTSRWGLHVSGAARNHSKTVQEFFLNIVMCNTVIVTNRHVDTMDDSGSILEGNYKGKNRSQDDLDKLSRTGDPPQKKPPLINLPDTPVTRKGVLPPLNPRDIGTPPTGKRSNGHANIGNVPPITFSSSYDFERNRDFGISTPSEGSIAGSSYISDGSQQSRYEAESPDELALVRAACTYGCRLVKRSIEKVRVWLPGEGEVEFEVLEVLQFDSTRKRMSVITRNPNNKELVMFTKGADTAVLGVLHRKFKEDKDLHRMVKETEKHILNYAMQGLRTLCMAKKVLTRVEYEEWKVRFNEASAAMEDREEKILQVSCEIEKDLDLLGATGIEDKLQEGVPETIDKLRKAGIKVWVLTGDKQETAIQVAYSSKLIGQKDQVLIINANDLTCTKDLLEHHLQQIERDTSGPTESSPLGRKQEYTLVIDGRTLAYALADKLEDTFLKLAQKCTSVVCCRSTPIQKGSVVKLVRDKLNKLTLAIGDGANDVSMIQVADIGIGISGQEGMQAVMASDFAISRFMFLQRLLLVHGHWCYCRLARFSSFMFYKSLISVLVMFWYQIYSAYSGSMQFDSLYTMLTHVVFCAFPPLVNGVLDKDLSSETLLKFPHIYKMGIHDTQYTRFSFFIALLDSIYQSVILYWVAHFAYESEQVGIWEFGTTQMVALILIILFTGAIDTYSWIWPQWLTMILSFVFFWLFAIVCHAIWFTFDHPANPYWVMQNTLVKPIHVITVVIITVLSLLPRFVIRIFQRTVFPDDIVKAQLWEKSQHTRRDSVHSVDTQDTGDIISDQEARRNGQQSAETDIRIRNGGTTKTSTTIA